MLFYGVKIKDKDLSFFFDALRFLAQPDALRHSHITVRGPYQRQINIEPYIRERLGDLGIISPGNFFYSNQNTVFLHCEIVGIRDIWNKPSYQDGIVHLTVYDGSDRDDAQHVNQLLHQYQWNIWTRPTELMLLEKKTVSTEALNILEPDFVRRFGSFFRFDRDISRVKRMKFSERLYHMKAILDYLEKMYMVPRFIRDS